MRPHRAALMAGAGLVAVLGAAACAGGSTPPPHLSAHGQQLSRILAGLEPKSVADQFELAMTARQQQLDVSCMAAHHLRYLAQDPDNLVDTVTETDFSSLDYAKTYGFGVTTFPHLTGTDPNAAALAAMKPAQRDAFNNQLSACDTAAGQQTDTEYDVTAANQAYDRIDKTVRADPAYRTAQDQWRRCAAAKGYQQPDRTTLIDSFQNKMGTIRDQLTAKAGAAGSPGDAEVATLAGNDAAFQQLHQQEVAAAVSTFPCSQALDATYRRLYAADQ
ncbi:MAG TPA: hypothetical protein VGJ45_04505 [Pseudonocardiaceae bacterium]|jgi:hypothetical protein